VGRRATAFGARGLQEGGEARAAGGSKLGKKIRKRNVPHESRKADPNVSLVNPEDSGRKKEHAALKTGRPLRRPQNAQGLRKGGGVVEKKKGRT